jgi:hypothetical protein
MTDTRHRGVSRVRQALSVVAAAALIGVSAVVAAPVPQVAQAVDGSDFMPGLIIADGLFYDSAAMTESDIQLFLASKGSYLANYTSTVASRPAQYSADTGGLICTPFTGGTLLASTIIYRAQAACGISAKVILVTLQKEQGLITKTAPSQTALDRAMGYACPDTAPCAVNSLGFGNQVFSGARQLHVYKVGRFARQPGLNYIQYHPNADCGGTNVYLQNYATAALYNYTPYQPNAAALANLGGTGDSCSSYGNRNFWRYYNSWFGSTLGNTPYPVASPRILGNSTVGTPLTVQPGVWRGSPTLTYSWISCPERPDVFVDGVPDGCSAIAGATTDTYTTKSADVGKYVAAVVTGTNSSGVMRAGALLDARVGSPANIVPPTVSGALTVGTTWTVDVGEWTGTPSPTIVVYWLRCTRPITAIYTTVPSGCTPITDQRSTTYVTRSADLGHYLTAQVGGINAHGVALAGPVSPRPIGFPSNVVAPTVTGDPTTIGSTWTATAGTWTGTPAPTFIVAWLRCAAPVVTPFTTVPSGCVAISGARNSTYVSTIADAGTYLTAQVGAINSLGTGLAGAVSTRAVQAAAPANTVAPTLSGSPTTGSTWTVTTGTWTGSPAPTFVVAWLRCDAPVASAFTAVPTGCVAISGARNSTYVTSLADVGKYVTAQVGGINVYGTGLAGAISTTAITSGAPVNTVAPTVSGSPSVGATWTVNPGTWTGSPAPTIVMAWLRCASPVPTAFASIPAGCVAISGARSSTYVTTTADKGSYLTAQVGGINTFGTVLTGAPSTTPISAAASPPVNTVAPTVSGSAPAGSTWTANTGTWTGSPTPTIVMAWLRCDAPITSGFTAVPAGCQAISGARSSTYVSTSADIGKYLTAQVGGINVHGTTLAGAVSTTRITAPAPASAPVNTVAPTVSGTPVVGATWTVNTGTWTGSPAPTIVVYWLRCTAPVTTGYTAVPAGCVAITGQRALSYVATAADVGKYLTAQVGAINPSGTRLAGAVSTTPIG